MQSGEFTRLGNERPILSDEFSQVNAHPLWVDGERAAIEYLVRPTPER